ALTINGPFRYDGDYAAFDSTSYGTFGAGAVDKIYPELWGANTTPGTTDMTTEIQAALDSAPTGSVVFLASNATYIISAPLTMATGVSFSGNLATIKLAASTDDHMVEFDTANTSDMSITNLIFDGNGANQTNTAGVNIIEFTKNSQRIKMMGNTFKNAGYTGIRTTGTSGSAQLDHIVITDNIFLDYYLGGVTLRDTDHFTVSNNIFDNTTNDQSAPQANGVVAQVRCEYGTIANNVIKMSAATSVSNVGIGVNTSTNISVTGNAIDCNGG
ncbi:unnamed protein product, partial [marine sediment metagenome]